LGFVGGCVEGSIRDLRGASGLFIGKLLSGLLERVAGFPEIFLFSFRDGHRSGNAGPDRKADGAQRQGLRFEQIGQAGAE
jgi:hypothetical protein